MTEKEKDALQRRLDAYKAVEENIREARTLQTHLKSADSVSLSLLDDVIYIKPSGLAERKVGYPVKGFNKRILDGILALIQQDLQAFESQKEKL